MTGRAPIRPGGGFAAVALAAVVVVGCEGPSPTGPNVIAPPSGGVFTGTVYPDGHTSWPFTLTSPGTVTLTLTSVDPPSLQVGLGFGTPSGRGCTLTSEVTAGAGSSPQVATAAEPGEKCAQVSDVGGVPTSGASFTVNIRGF